MTQDTTNRISNLSGSLARLQEAAPRVEKTFQGIPFPICDS